MLSIAGTRCLHLDDPEPAGRLQAHAAHGCCFKAFSIAIMSATAALLFVPPLKSHKSVMEVTEIRIKE